MTLFSTIGGVFFLHLLTNISVGGTVQSGAHHSITKLPTFAHVSSELGTVYENETAKNKEIRLPLDVVPISYVLRLVPFIIPNNFTIKGSVSIQLACVKDTKDVKLHSKEIRIDNVNVLDALGNQKSIEGEELDSEREFLVVRMKESLLAGSNYTLAIDFVSRLNEELSGFYRSTYSDHSGNEVLMATTQFEPTHARRAFPCFDEPALKATFEISLGRTEGQVALSNMPIKEGMAGVKMEHTPEYVWDHFERSVPMSTYLVAMIICDFDRRVSDSSNDVEVAVWARRDAIEQTEYARGIAARMLRYFEVFFDVAYPLPKQDMVAIPDFASGAMENWGLITYRETALLFKSGTSSRSNMQRIASVVSHELAHQWFGNLVSPAWWNDLWLNEGFASYVEYLGVDAVEPGMRMMDQFVIEENQSVMQVDSLESSHKISVPVYHPDEISEIFDRISYSKGAAIIRMMEHFLTSETFRRGLTNYLNDLYYDHSSKYRSATQDDLWEHLTDAAHADGTLNSSMSVKEIMDTWTLQAGYPVVHVNTDGHGKAVITQQRFFPAEGKTDDSRWWIPITMAAPLGGDFPGFNDTYSRIWMSPEEKVIRLAGLPQYGMPIVFNVQETGYYRVNYDRHNWENIARCLEDDREKVHEANRAQIIDDAFNLARAGMVGYDLVFGLTRSMHKEKSYIVWKAARRGFRYIETMLARTGAYGEFQRYAKNFLQPSYSRLGHHAKTDDEHTDVLLRLTIAEWSCTMEMKECCDEAKEEFESWAEAEGEGDDLQSQRLPIDADMKAQVFCTGIALGGEKEWNHVWDKYLTSKVPSEKRKLLMALPCTKHIWLLNKLLNMTITSNSGIRAQDVTSVIGKVARNIYGRDLAFDFVRSQWDELSKVLHSRIGKVVGILKNRNTMFELEELKDFRSARKGELGSGARTMDQAIEDAVNNISWMSKNYQTIVQLLAKANTESGLP